MKTPATDSAGVGHIEMKLRKVAQLFDTMDPSPFRESDLAVQAEEYIVGRAMELPGFYHRPRRPTLEDVCDRARTAVFNLQRMSARARRLLTRDTEDN